MAWYDFKKLFFRETLFLGRIFMLFRSEFNRGHNPICSGSKNVCFKLLQLCMDLNEAPVVVVLKVKLQSDNDCLRKIVGTLFACV